MSNYVLENINEFERLEKQSNNKSYNYEVELKDFSPKPNGAILDAGCGSGIVTRYLANKYPNAQVVGCDFSAQRISQATNHFHSVNHHLPSNISFRAENLTNMTFNASSFDAINCRYVLEHMSNPDALQTLEEFHRCMRPNGKLSVIDIDGLIYNLFPRTNYLENSFTVIQNLSGIDLNIGRKLPFLITTAGFTNVQWKIETLQFQDEDLTDETQLIEERFELAMPTLTNVLGGENKAHQFVEEYFACLKKPGAVLFYNKFIISAEKSVLKIQR